MPNIKRYSPYSPIEDLFNEFTRGFFVRAEIPGVRREDIHVDVDAQGAKAEYKDGVLNLTLPKIPGAEARRISIA